MGRLVFVFLVFGLCPECYGYVQLLLGNSNENLQVYDACSSLEGTSALVAGTRHSGIIQKSVYLGEVVEEPKLHAEWESFVNVSNGLDEYGFGICVVEQNVPNHPYAEYIVCGYIDALQQLPALYLFDGDGNLEACMNYGSEVSGRFKSIIQTRDGGFALLGETQGSPSQVFVLVVDSRLQYKWHNVYDGFFNQATESYTYPNCIMETDPNIGEMLVILVTPHNGTEAGHIVSVDNSSGSLTEGEFLYSYDNC